MKRRPCNFIVPLIIYPFDIMFSVGETDHALMCNLVKRLQEKECEIFNHDEYLFRMPETCTARTVHSLIGGQTVIRFKPKPEQGIVSHEIFHAVCFILRRIGMDLNQSSDEAYAYLIQYVTEQFYKEMSI